MKKKLIIAALGVAAGCAVACAVVHRKVIVAMVKGAPLPEPPAGHPGHCAKK